MKSFPLFTCISMLGIILAHSLAFAYVPMEREMGAVQRIFYFHLPSAWLCYLGFIVCAVASLRYLLSGESRHDALALSAAEVGLTFGVVVLTTGPLWARVAWGTWWKWEPRLTTMALLFLIFAAYWLLRSFGGPGEGLRKFSAVLAVFGAPNIVFVHIAVTRWRGDHPNNIRLDPEMRVVLYSALFFMIILFIQLLRLRYQSHLQQRTLAALRRRLSRLSA
ncbi:MAG: cytochrome c biogenesis protein CcsA [Myxococcota bacterium]|nr:cytochrome c biogenesis protein CcsA [Myxococcota bacterium]